MKLDLIGFKNRLLCERCLAQYEMTSGQKWLFSFGSAVFTTIAIYAGIFSQSWFVFFLVGIGFPMALHIFIGKYAKLKLVGIKGTLRDKGL